MEDKLSSIQKAKAKMVLPKANLKICQLAFPESVTSGLVGVRALLPMQAKFASIPTPPNTKDVEKAFLLVEIRKVREKAKAAREVAKEQLVATLAEVLTSNVIARKTRSRKEKEKDVISHQAEKVVVANEKVKAVTNHSRPPNKNASIGTQALANMVISVSIITREIAAIGQAPKAAPNNIAIGGMRRKRKAQL